MNPTFDQRRERFWKSRDDAKRLIYKIAERISDIPPELADYFAEAQRLRLMFEEDQNNQAFRKPIGASGRLDNDLWIKCEYMESKDKYRVTHLHNRSEPNFPDFMPVHLSPRFKVYVQD